MEDDYWYLKYLSMWFGWIYFTAWSMSFYPQVYLNWKNKSVAGFSIDFAILNMVGFFFYSMYSLGGFIYPHLGTGNVVTNDLFFALNAFMLWGWQLTQVFIYDSGHQSKFRSWVKYLLVVEITCFLTVFMMEGFWEVKDIPLGFNTFSISGYNKALITFLKYMPQVYLNWSSKSTAGWSIFVILFDFTGGIFSIGQEVVDNVHWHMTSDHCSFFGSGDSFNMIKFSLGVFSIWFDMMFMSQHYYLYPEKKEETEHLLPKLKHMDSQHKPDAVKQSTEIS